jgi:ADP-ribose pyrophosphatase YjhB (NUDIX family)
VWCIVGGGFMKVTAGILLYRQVNKKIQILLVHNGRSWSLPKGTVNGKETTKAAACRELFEETKLKAPIDLIELGHVIDFQKPEKLHCFIAEYEKKKSPTASSEIVHCRFYSLTRARKLIAAYQLPLLECLIAIEKIRTVA